MIIKLHMIKKWQKDKHESLHALWLAHHKENTNKHHYIWNWKLLPFITNYYHKSIGPYILSYLYTLYIVWNKYFILNIITAITCLNNASYISYFANNVTYSLYVSLWTLYFRYYTLHLNNMIIKYFIATLLQFVYICFSGNIT